MQRTKSKPIGKPPASDPKSKPDDTPEKDKPELDQERPANRSDFESERSFHESNKRSSPDPETDKHGAT
jgi:hypothetical protein